jgi:hypothetical protein
VLAFVREARSTRGVRRIALLGSLATDKPMPKDADVLVTIDAATDLGPLARSGRRLQGTAQRINLGADIFLADEAHRYIGRICHYRECHPRVARRALSCGRRQHLNDDLQIVTLSPTLISAPPIQLWSYVVARCTVPVDTHPSGRRTSQDLRPSERRAANEAGSKSDALYACPAEIGGNPDLIYSRQALPLVTLAV